MHAAPGAGPAIKAPSPHQHLTPHPHRHYNTAMKAKPEQPHNPPETPPHPTIPPLPDGSTLTLTPEQEAATAQQEAQLWRKCRVILLAWVTQSLPMVPPSGDLGRIKCALDAVSMIAKLAPGSVGRVGRQPGGPAAMGKAIDALSKVSQGR